MVSTIVDHFFKWKWLSFIKLIINRVLLFKSKA
jgi:hypothetical protein